jgi:hypothetical protein
MTAIALAHTRERDRERDMKWSCERSALADVLADSITESVMTADRVDVQKLAAVLAGVAVLHAD